FFDLLPGTGGAFEGDTLDEMEMVEEAFAGDAVFDIIGSNETALPNNAVEHVQEDTRIVIRSRRSYRHSVFLVDVDCSILDMRTATCARNLSVFLPLTCRLLSPGVLPFCMILGIVHHVKHDDKALEGFLPGRLIDTKIAGMYPRLGAA